MSVQVETLEKNMAKLTIELAEDKLEDAMQKAYLKQKRKINLPGFRKGKAPRHMVEKMFGPEVFYEDASDILIRENYSKAIDESGADLVSRPVVDIVQIEKGKPFIFTIEAAVKPEVKLGEYKGIEVTKIDTSVTDEEVDAEIEKERNTNARTVTVEGRPIQEGDTAVIDFEGFVDGEPFEGGMGENYSLQIGSHSFIDTFEEQLVGKNAGEELEVQVTFPEEYHAAELAGKPATFQVKIHEIKAQELPELDDEFAQDISEFDTLAEYKESVRKAVSERKEAEAKRAKEEEAIKKIVEQSTMDIPEAMVETQAENMVEEFARGITQQVMSFEQYMQFSGMSVEKMKEQMKPDALSRIQGSLVLEQIVKEEGIEVTEEDFDAAVAKMAPSYGMGQEKLKEMIGEEEKESMMKDLAISKAADLILENVKECEKAGGEEGAEA